MKKLLVSPFLFYIKFWAKFALLIHKPITIGIAGSVGKSSARNAMYAVLSSQAKTLKVSGNSETGVPLGILSINISDYSIYEWIKIFLITPLKIFSTLEYKYAVIEMGIDDPFPPKNMEYLLSIVKPDISIDLNAAATHTMQFEKLLPQKPAGISDLDFLVQKIAEEDIKVITKIHPSLGIYNGDDENIVKALKNYHGRLSEFGEKSKSIKYGEYEVTEKGTRFEFILDDEKLEIKIAEQALPLVYREVFAAVLLAAKELSVDISQAVVAINQKFALPKGRSTILTGKMKSIIIDSSYNSSAEAVITFLDLLNLLSKSEKRTAIFLMGDMRELGKEASSEHQRVAKKINESVDILYCVGPLTEKHILPHINPQITTHWYSNAKTAAEKLLNELPERSIILVKGSQNQIYLEEATKILLADPKDVKKLCRQTSFWMKVKNEYFQGL